MVFVWALFRKNIHQVFKFCVFIYFWHLVFFLHQKERKIDPILSWKFASWREIFSHICKTISFPKISSHEHFLIHHYVIFSGVVRFQRKYSQFFFDLLKRKSLSFRIMFLLAETAKDEMMFVCIPIYAFFLMGKRKVATRKVKISERKLFIEEKKKLKKKCFCPN